MVRGVRNFMNENDLIKKSKFLSLILRHKPEEIDIELDKNGWTSVADLLYATHWSISDLDEVVEKNNKKRFEYNDNKTMIRACQGHSVNVDLNLPPSNPPSILYHGTSTRFLKSIFKNGIIAKGRNLVHLSEDFDTAIQVGSRHGHPIVLLIMASDMDKDGYTFCLSNNGVWLTKEVPVKYFKINRSNIWQA